MYIVNFGSSSAGNCYWVELDRENDEPVKLLIEAGIPYRDIVRRAASNGLNLLDLDAVLITHEHQDHARSAKALADRGLKVYGNADVCSGIREELQPNTLKVIAPDTYVVPFEVEHDAFMPLGYVIYTGLEKILFVADCKFWKADLSGQQFDYVIIEANYDGRLLHFAYENAKEEMKYEEAARYKRVFNAHMSLNNCIKALQKMDLIKCKAIFLIHLSDRNARELYFKEEVQRIIGIRCLVAKKYGGFI